MQIFNNTIYIEIFELYALKWTLLPNKFNLKIRKSYLLYRSILKTILQYKCCESKKMAIFC